MALTAGAKRQLETSPAGPSKKPHPFFSGSPKPLGTFLPSHPTLVHFLHLDPFGSTSSPAYPTSTPTPTQAPTPIPTPTGSTSRSKVPIVFYDLDGTLIKTKSKARFPKNREDWVWWHESVPKRLKAEHDEGKHLVVISNQGSPHDKTRGEWRAKVSLIAAKMPADVPLRVLAALSKDVYRKPNIGMFETVEAVYRAQGLEIDLENSVFIGDAAGRLASKAQMQDHGDTDYKFALNIGVPFRTPEEHFLGHPRPPFPIPPTGFRPSKLGSLASLPYIVPSHTPITRSTLEIVLFVGPPASGKTSFYWKHFAPRYEHVNQDILRSRDRCLRVAEDTILAGKPVIVDNTNRNRETRAHWTALAAKLHVPIRVFHFLCPLELAKHNNMYRACYAPPDEPPRSLLPLSAFTSYAAMLEPPKKDEGFDEVRCVNFVFEGNEEQRKKWDMYMLEYR